MHAGVQDDEYLAEIRKQVCDRCPERAPARAPFTPGCWRCGAEFQLHELVEAVHDTDGGSGPVPGPRAVCARCSRLGHRTCPCPVASLTSRLVQAIRTVDERHEQWEILRRRLTGHGRPRFRIEDLVRAYEAATGTCVCCD